MLPPPFVFCIRELREKPLWGCDVKAPTLTRIKKKEKNLRSDEVFGNVSSECGDSIPTRSVVQPFWNNTLRIPDVRKREGIQR